MSTSGPSTLFHFSFAVDNLEQARRFYGELLGCPEGRKLPGRADFNFFGHHIVAHLSPNDVVGDHGKKLGTSGKTPVRHFGIVTTLDEFRKIADKLERHDATFLNRPEVTQKGTVREQMLMTVSDECGNAIEFKGLRQIADVYAVNEDEKSAAV